MTVGLSTGGHREVVRVLREAGKHDLAAEYMTAFLGAWRPGTFIAPTSHLEDGAVSYEYVRIVERVLVPANLRVQYLARPLLPDPDRPDERLAFNDDDVVRVRGVGPRTGPGGCCQVWIRNS